MGDLRGRGLDEIDDRGNNSRPMSRSRAFAPDDLSFSAFFVGYFGA